MNLLITLLLFFFVALGVPESKQSHDNRTADLQQKLGGARGTLKVDLLIELCNECIPSDLSKAVSWNRLAKQEAELLGYRSGKANALLAEARIHWEKAEYESVIRISGDAAVIFVELTEQKGLYWTYYLLGRSYFRTTEFQRSAENLQEALKLIEYVDESDKTPLQIYLNLAMIYSRFMDLNQSREYAKAGFSLAKKQKDYRWQGILLNQIAGYEYLEKKYRKALEIYEEVAELYRKAGDQNLLIGTLYSKCLIKYHLGEYKSALDLIQQCIEYYKKIDWKRNLTQSYFLLGNIYLATNQYTKSEESFHLAILSAKRDGQFSENWVYAEYADVCYQRGMYKEAYEYYLKHVEIQNKLFSQEKEKEIAVLQKKLDAFERDKEIDLLKRDKKIARLSRWILIAVLALAILILALILKRYMYLFAFWKKQKYIGQYRITETIGSGGMGIVYKGHPLRDKTASVAIKVLREEFQQDDAYIRRFKREGTIVDRLDHPHILKVHERGEHEGRLYLVMEYLPGKTLDKLIAETGPLPISLCRQITLQICDALEQVHSRQIVHCDLKAANVMVMEGEGSSVSIKLLDFGLAKVSHHSRLTTAGVIMGTLSHVAPESFQAPQFSPAADIYSLGIVFYQMLTGRLPFQEDSVQALVEKIMVEQPDAPEELRPDIPPRYSELVQRMLDKDPEKRPGAAGIKRELMRSE